jgi:hypothetical protein
VIAYCVESHAFDADGNRVGTFRLYTGDKARAEALVAEAPGRRCVELGDDAIPEHVRANLERAVASVN